jgi:nucleoside-diphosphate-sugar epimerase
MKALITGAPGWLGSLLAETLVREGRQVRCIVQPGTAIEKLKALGAEIVIGDVTVPGSLNNACKDISVVFHCAGMIHPGNIRGFYEVNTCGTKNLAESAINAGVEKFIYVSSNVAGLGSHHKWPVSESDKPMPFMHYGLSKLRAEEILLDYYRRGMIKSIIIRPNWLYGVNAPVRQLRFIRMVKKQKPVYFNIKGSLHSLCSIENCIQALILSEKSGKAVGQRYYIADEKPYNIIEVYKTIADALNIKAYPRHICDFSYDSVFYKLTDIIMQPVRYCLPEIHMAWEWSKNLVCSINKAKRDLGYIPRVDFKAGIKLAIEWYKKNEVDI